MEATLNEKQVRRWKRYRSFAKTRVIWIDRHPSDWIGIPIKRWVATPITDGPHETPEILSEGIDFVSAESMKDGKIDFDFRRGYISRQLHEIYCRKLRPQRDDIFMCKSGATTGKIAMVDTDREFNVWSPLALIRVDQDRMFPRYMYWALNSGSVQNQVKRTWSEGTQPNISMQNMERLFIVAPKSVREQRAIAAFLDRETARIDALIGHKQRLIALLEEKRQAVISRAVTKGLDPNVEMKDSGTAWIGDVPAHWTVPPVAAFCNVVRGGSPRPAGDPLYFNGTDTPWITVAETTKDKEKYLTETEEYLTAEGRKRSRFLEVDTFILTNSGATLGVPKILRIAGCINDGSVAFLNIDGHMSKDYLYYYFTSQTDDIRIRMNQGMGQPNLNTNIVSRMPVPKPPLNEQLRIADHLDEMFERSKKQVETISNSINLLQEYRTGLISAAVTGQIDVRNEVQLDD